MFSTKEVVKTKKEAHGFPIQNIQLTIASAAAHRRLKNFSR